ncbi:metallophosphoesterase family protein [Spiractinospora alimapuensis]|uniref:purple acid phosphatase family protein n=1 Tax=Spiractinospora alimapuensis TaxID=2820884 RepID=UPI001F20FBEF|nr:metallophosphoesterase family protein [Spiractinospora alimapuensis]QVQ52706.1 metallophosphoesterase family protein [Spiractinospora alimapuensis]
MVRHSTAPGAVRVGGARTRRGHLLVALALVCSTACGPRGPESSGPDVILTPTADPATSQTVSWGTTASSAATLEITPRDAPDQVTRVEGTSAKEESEGPERVRATVTDLEADTQYRYRVESGEDGFDEWRSFTTAASAPEPFTFLYFGDVQTDIPDGAAPVIQAGLEAHPDADLIVHSGDLIDEARDARQWQEWYDAYGADVLAGRNQLPAVGNHEYDDGLSEFWPAQFPAAGNGPDAGADLAETVSYTDYQGVRFVTLNSNYREAPADDETEEWLDTQALWLDSVLEDNPHDWAVVTFHHPLFPNRPDRDNEALRSAWLDTLEDNDVDLVLQGHDHSYGRGNLTDHRTDEDDTQTGPVYVVAVTGPKMYEAGPDLWEANAAEVRGQRTDAQTFQAVAVDGDELEFTATTGAGDPVDTFTISKQGETKRVVDEG